MKKILAIGLLTASMGATAFWGGSAPWGNSYQDNGIFGFNPYDYWNPNWYSQEMDNMIDEFDDNGRGNSNGYNGYGYNSPSRYPNPYSGNTPWNNAPWGNGYNRSAPIRTNAR